MTGVDFCNVLDKIRGIGTVDVIISGASEQIGTLLTQVQAHIEAKQPAGVDCLVREVRHVTKTFIITQSGLTNAKAIAAAESYLNAVGVGGTAVLAKIVAAVVNAGATDCHVTSPTSNFALESDQLLLPTVEVAT